MAFKKVSYEQYSKDVGGDEDVRQQWEDIKLPVRATAGSAGYDICSPVDFSLEQGEDILLPLGIRAEIPAGSFLMVVPRSGLGTKYGVHLKNTIGIVDEDYSKAQNEGHIFVDLVNGFDRRLKISKGDRIVQAIVVPYILMEDDNATEVRVGGHGSTGN